MRVSLGGGFWVIFAVSALMIAEALGRLPIGTIGRIGCFLNGCCWGDACQLPWAVQFPRDSGPWRSEVARGLIAPSSEHSLPLHPTQLYSTIDGFVLMFLLLTFYPLRKRDGEVIALLMVTYPILRFLVEQLRNDEGIFLLGMTISQVISVVLFTIGVLGIFVNRKNVIVILMSIELMLLAVNINLVAFSAQLGDLTGQVFALIILTVAAAEAAIGLAILVVFFRNRGSIAVEDVNVMKG